MGKERTAKAAPRHFQRRSHAMHESHLRPLSVPKIKIRSILSIRSKTPLPPPHERRRVRERKGRPNALKPFKPGPSREILLMSVAPYGVTVVLRDDVGECTLMAENAASMSPKTTFRGLLIAAVISMAASLGCYFLPQTKLSTATTPQYGPGAIVVNLSNWTDRTD
jgi:hypothetical protein